MTDIVIYGAGGFAREVAQLILDLADDGAPLNVIGFLSDDGAMQGTVVGDLPVLGNASFLEKNSGCFDVAIAVGTPAVKRRISRRIKPSVRDFPVLIHPTVVRSSRIQFGVGSVVCAMNVLTVDIKIGDFATVNLGCTIGHDAVLADFATVAPGVNISGNVSIGEGCDIGTGTKIIQGRNIGEWTIVGAGAVVSSDLPANCTAVGVPARVIKQREAGWQLSEEP